MASYVNTLGWVLLPPEGIPLTHCERLLAGSLLGLAITVGLLVVCLVLTRSKGKE